jgi:hypothetical protein
VVPFVSPVITRGLAVVPVARVVQLVPLFVLY